LAETGTSGNTVNEYIFLAGVRIARRDGSGNIHYYFQDQSGTPAGAERAAKIRRYCESAAFGVE